MPLAYQHLERIKRENTKSIYFLVFWQFGIFREKKRASRPLGLGDTGWITVEICAPVYAVEAFSICFFVRSVLQRLVVLVCRFGSHQEILYGLYP
jgi:hypothetical protein